MYATLNALAAIKEEDQQMSGEKTTSASNPSPIQAALEAIRSAPPALNQNGSTRHHESQSVDRFHEHIVSHRHELDSIDVRITSLDRSIELEQQKLRESKAALEESYHARRRLLHLRLAMVNFVQELEAKQVDD